MKQFDFTPNSSFYPEILTFSLPFVSIIALIRFPELKVQIDELVARYNVRRRGVLLPPTTIPNIVIPDLFTLVGDVASPTLLDCQRLASEVQQYGSITELSWVDENLVLPEEQVAHEEGELRRMAFDRDATFNPIGQVTLGAAFERIKDGVESNWGTDPWLWPSEIQYLRHCRNAAFHHNRFAIAHYRGRPGINPAAPPAWRSSAMPDDSTMNAKSLMGDWLSLGDIPILLGDVQETLSQNGVRI